MKEPLAFIESCDWTFASTMPWIPHWYIVRRNVDARLFDELALYIRIEGRLGRWGAPHMHWYLHFPGHDYYYWTMGGALEETLVINRAETSTDNVRYLDEGNLNRKDRDIIDRWCDYTQCPECRSFGQVQKWDSDDLFGTETRLVSLQCPHCGYRAL